MKILLALLKLMVGRLMFEFSEVVESMGVEFSEGEIKAYFKLYTTSMQ